MARKGQQIKHVLIDVKTRGGKEAEQYLEGINSGLQAIGQTSGKLLEYTKTLESLHKRSQLISSSFSDMAKSVKSMNTAINGSTKTAEKRINSFIDNIDIVSLSIKELKNQADKAFSSLSKLPPNSSIGGMGVLEDSLSAIVIQLNDLVEESKHSSRAIDRLVNHMEDNTDATREGTRAQEGYNRQIKEGISGLTRFGTSTELVNNNVRRLSGSSRGAAKAFSRLALGANPLVSTYAAIAVNVIAISEAFRLLSEAAAFARLKDQLASFSAAISGVDVTSLAAKMKQLSGEAISLKESLQFATKGVAFDFTTDQLNKLTIGARKASIALGLNFSDAMDRVLRGITKQEIELFDELGIVTRLTPAFKKYSAEVGKTVEQLSDYERQTALANEVLRQFDERFSGQRIEATSYEVLAAVIKDLKDSTLITIQDALTPLADKMAELVQDSDPLIDNLNLLSRTSETLTTAMDKTNGSVGVTLTAFAELANAVVQSEAALAESQEATLSSGISFGQLSLSILAGATAAGIFITTLKSLAAVLVTIKVVSGEATVALGIVTLLSRGFLALASAIALNPIVWLSAALIGVGVAAYTASSQNDELTESMEKQKKITDELTEAREKLRIATADLAKLGVRTEVFAEETRNRVIQKRLELEEKLIKAQDKLAQLRLSKSKAPPRRLTTDESSGIKQATSMGIDLPPSRTEIESVHKYIEALIRQRDVLATSTGFALVLKEVMEEYGTAIKASEKSIVSATSKIENFALKSSKVTTTFSEQAEELNKLINLPLNPDKTSVGQLVSLAEKSFADLRKSIMDRGLVPWDSQLSSAEELAKAIDKAHKSTLELQHTSSVIAEQDKLRGETNSRAILNQIKLQQEHLDTIKILGSLSGKEVKSAENKVAILKAQLRVAQALESVQKQQAAVEFEHLKTAAKLSQTYLAPSKELELQVDLINKRTEAALMQDGLGRERLDQIKLEASREREILEIRIKQAKLRENESIVLSSMTSELRSISRVQASATSLADALGISSSELNKSLSSLQLLNKERDIAAKQLENLSRKTEGGLIGSPEQIKEAEDAVKDLEARIAVLNSTLGLSRVNDLANSFERLKSSISELGLTSLQLEFMEMFSALDVSLNKLSESLLTLGQDSGMFDGIKFGFESLLTAMTEGTDGMSVQQQAAVESTVSSLTAIGQMGSAIFQELSDSRVLGIENEIAAERRRDGKSQESLAKIKKLEREKIKEQAKAKKAHVIMSTAMAIMQGYAELGPIGGSIAAVGLAILGALQLANIDKAASGQSASLDSGGSSSMKITGGTKDNSIDVSKAATAGELSFIRGGEGSGTASNFTAPGRAGGGYSPAGNTITVGERGPEELTPLVPVNITPNGSSSGTAPIQVSINMSVDAIDTRSFADRIHEVSAQVREALEAELNATNQSLSNLA